MADHSDWEGTQDIARAGWSPKQRKRVSKLKIPYFEHMFWSRWVGPEATQPLRHLHRPHRTLVDEEPRAMYINTHLVYPSLPPVIEIIFPLLTNGYLNA